MLASVAKDLPLDLDDCATIKFRGVGGESFDTRLGKFTVKIMDAPVAVTCAFAPRENTPFILDRKDIFSMFSILFENARKFVKFSPIE
jgi:hypothetical protein